MRIIMTFLLLGLAVPVFAQPEEELKTEALYENPKSRTYFKEWLMLGPIPVKDAVEQLKERGTYAPDESQSDPDVFRADGSEWLGWGAYTEAMQKSLLVDDGDDGELHPTYGSTVLFSGTEYSWNYYETRYRNMNFDSFYNRHENVIVYAYAEIEMSEAKDMKFLLRSDDMMMMWVNGEEEYRYIGGRGVDQGEDRVTVHLNEGINPILVKVMNMHLDWGFSVQVRELSDVSMEDVIEDTLENAIETAIEDSSVFWIPLALFLFGLIILVTLFFVIRAKFGRGDKLHG